MIKILITIILVPIALTALFISCVLLVGIGKGIFDAIRETDKKRGDLLN